MTGADIPSPRTPAAVGDRIAGILLAVIAAGAWWHSHTFVTGFMHTVGPGAFPRLVSILLGLLSAYLIVRPGFNQRWPEHSALLRQFGLLIVLGAYAALLEPWGFLPATLLATILLIRLFGANWKQAMGSSALLTVTLYLLFEFALGIPLTDIPGMSD